MQRKGAYPDETILKHLQKQGYWLLFLQLQNEKYCSLKLKWQKFFLYNKGITGV